MGLIDTHYIYKIGKQQGPTDSTGNYIQYFEITYNGKESEKEKIHKYWITLLYS